MADCCVFLYCNIQYQEFVDEEKLMCSALSGLISRQNISCDRSKASGIVFAANCRSNFLPLLLQGAANADENRLHKREIIIYRSHVKIIGHKLEVIFFFKLD